MEWNKFHSVLWTEGSLFISPMPVLKAITLKNFSFSWEIRKKNKKTSWTLAKLVQNKQKKGKIQIITHWSIELSGFLLFIIQNSSLNYHLWPVTTVKIKFLCPSFHFSVPLSITLRLQLWHINCSQLLLQTLQILLEINFF